MKQFALVCVVLAGPVALACPDLSTNSNLYTEVAVPCNGATPDYTQAVAVNQADGAGGECRVQPASGNQFFVPTPGTELVTTDADGNSTRVGILLSLPNCYQTDSGNGYVSSWSQVLLDSSSTTEFTR